MERDRFKEGWNGLALIFLMTGIFLNFRPLGYSAVAIAILMWILGGTIRNMIFGSKSKRRRDDGTKILEPGEKLPDGVIEIHCQSCGYRNSSDSKFCMECGSSLEGIEVKPAGK